MYVDTCDQACSTPDWASPAGPAPRPDLAPVVTRTGGSNAPWQLTCPGAGLWGGPWKRKGEAVAVLKGSSAENLTLWLSAAYAWLEREPGGYGSPDRRTLCVAREVDAPESACGHWHVEPCFKEPDWDGVVRGLWWTCGNAICPYWQNCMARLAQHRLGWDDRQVSAAYVAPQWEPARERWYAALRQASTDLSAGVGDDEAAALGASEATRPYLRLEETRRADLGRGCWALAGREAAPYYDPESWPGSRTCWGASS